LKFTVCGDKIRNAPKFGGFRIDVLTITINDIEYVNLNWSPPPNGYLAKTVEIPEFLQKSVKFAEKKRNFHVFYVPKWGFIGPTYDVFRILMQK
jgi:hypothetical protein